MRKEAKFAFEALLASQKLKMNPADFIAGLALTVGTAIQSLPMSRENKIDTVNSMARTVMEMVEQEEN